MLPLDANECDREVASTVRNSKTVDEFLARNRRVFLVHGRNLRMKQEMIAFLKPHSDP
jgi:hypothetical protein